MAVATAGSPPDCRLPPEIVTTGAAVYPEPPSVMFNWKTTPCLYSVA